MTPTLQDLIDSAKLCGWTWRVKEVHALPLTDAHKTVECLGIDGDWFEWKPSDQPFQDREIRDALLAKGWSVHFDGIHVKPQGYIASMTKEKRFFCDANDFLVLAGAHVYRREHE